MNNLNQQRSSDAANPAYEQWATSTESEKTGNVELSPERRQEIVDTLADVITNSTLDLNHKIVAEPAHIVDRYYTNYVVDDDLDSSPEPPEAPENPGAPDDADNELPTDELEPKDVAANDHGQWDNSENTDLEYNLNLPR